MNPARERNLRALAKLMNQQNITSIPVTKKLLNCFDLVITPEENDFLLKLGTKKRTFDEALHISQLLPDSFKILFNEMLSKGLIWTSYAEEGTEYYNLAPILLGWFEIYLSDGQETERKKEFAHRVEELFESWGKLNVFPVRNLWNFKHSKGTAHRRIYSVDKSGNQTIRVQLNRKIDAADTKIYPAQSVFELIEKYGTKNEIAVVHCFCRQWHKMIENSCRFDFPAESCVVIGSLSKYVVNYGIGKYISKKEALELILELQSKGAVHQVYHEREDINLQEIAICNCCWDCCGILGSYNRARLPLHFKSYYLSEISNIKNCTGCKRCVKYCPVEALTMRGKKVALDTGKCIGCGQCELKCEENVFKLCYVERDVILPLRKKVSARIKS